MTSVITESKNIIIRNLYLNSAWGLHREFRVLNRGISGRNLFQGQLSKVQAVLLGGKGHMAIMA